MRTFITISILVIGAVACQAQTNASEESAYERIDQAQMIELMANNAIEVIDVRTPGEVRSGYIDEADYFFDINDPVFAQRIEELPKDKPYIVYCRSGARSGSAADFMIKQGFTKVYDLKGGMMNWRGKDHIVR